MKIIEDTSKIDYTTWSHNTQCEGCRSSLQIEYTDIKCTIYTNDYGSLDEYFFIHCAVCNVFNKINYLYIPFPIQLIARHNAKKKEEKSPWFSFFSKRCK